MENNDWTKNAIEPFFKLIKKDDYLNNRINCENVVCKKSKIVMDQLGVFSKKKFHERRNYRVGNCNNYTKYGC